MRRLVPALLVLVLLAGALPLPTSQAQEDRRCVTPPEVHESYEWAYEDQEGTERFEEIIDQQLTSSKFGHHNTTTVGFMEREAGQWTERGRFLRFANGTPWPLAKLSQDTWTPASDGGETHRVEHWDPPRPLVLEGIQTCPGERWQLETYHSVYQTNPGAQGGVNESWQVGAHPWETVEVPAGSFEALKVVAIRLNDCKRVTTYHSPEARAAVRVVETEGLDQAPSSYSQCRQELPVKHDWELTWFTLDQRPNARFKLHPAHPEAGGSLILDGTPSWDPDGNLTSYRWVVDAAGGTQEYHGANVTLTDLEEGTLRIRLFVTDEADRTTTLGTTIYVPTKGGSGIAVDGALAAYEGEYVGLHALPSFDPLRVRWRVADQVVGDGERFQFQMDDTVTFQVDAFHSSGRVYTTNHTVTLLEGTRGNATTPGAQGSARQAPDQWPQGGSEVLALLAPLEGQVVEPRITARIWTSDPATLTVDGEEVWRGTGPSDEVDLELDPGRHTLVLSSDEATHTVNVTASDGSMIPGLEGDGSTTDPSPIPGPTWVLWIAVLAALNWAGRRKRTGT